MNALYVYIYLLLNLPSPIISSPCEIPDRKYNCDCILHSNNRTLIFEDDERYNSSTNNFLPAIQSLKYCDGSFLCRTGIKPTIPPISTSNHLLCFSDVSCLLSGRFENRCSCMPLNNLHEYNITNNAFNIGTYTCIKVGYEGLQTPYCLKNACRSFTVIERFCICPQQSWNCTCLSYCDDLPVSPSQGTYALFFSFGDIYVISDAKSSTIHWLVVFVLFVGLTFLLFTFCKLCERVVDTRRAPSAKNTSAEGQQANQVAPPPSYEQVMKDKCIEFKRSVVRPEIHIIDQESI